MYMKNIASKHIQFALPIEIQFLAIPTRWTVREEKMSGERCLVPAVSQHAERRLSRVADPEEIRKQLFRMKIDEESACGFLNGVGVWSAIGDAQMIEAPDGSLLSGNAPVGIREMRLSGAFGHRWLSGRASIETVESLQGGQKHWRELKRNSRKLRAAFAPQPASSTPHLKDMFALESQFGNTLPVHLEWRGKHPRAVIQPITGRELLIALAWIDLVTGAECKVCQNQNCGIEYTRGGSKFCSPQCEHANTIRTYRMNLKEKAGKKEHPLKKTN
jgi:hypothetical protein